MLRKLARLFTIRTRTEAYLVTYAIAVGACERGKTYLETVPGWLGMFLALCCVAVVFVAGGKLLDAVRAEQAAPALPARMVPRRGRKTHLHRHERKLVTGSRPSRSSRAG